MSTTATIPYARTCDVCTKTAEYDAKTIHGPWANLCREHWELLTEQRLGTGYGQRLVVA